MAAVQPIEPAAPRLPTGVLRAAGAAAALAAAALVAAWLALGVMPRYDAGVTGGGGMATNKVGFYGLEYDRAGAPYRWTGGYAFVQMPHAYRAAPAYLAELRLRSEHPGGPRPLLLLANERALAVVTPSAQFRVYRLALPPPQDGAPELRLALSTPTFQPAENPRPLGVIVTDAALWPAPHDDWPLILTLALGPALLLAALLARGQPLGPAAITAAVIGAALLLLAWRAHPAPLRLEWMAWMALLAAAAAALIGGWQATLGLGALAGLVAFSGALWPSWLTDDAFISFRYAQNLVAGRGLVYNIGERVEGYTNFLWTMLAALALALGADIVVATYAAGVALALALVLATFAIGRRLLGPGWALAAALFVGTCQSLLVYTARGGGLETGLFALLGLLAAGAHLAERRRPALVGALLGLATLTRPEGAMLLALTVGHAWLRGEGRGARGEGHELHAEGEAVAPPVGPRPAHHATLRTQTLQLALAYAALVLPFFAWRLGYYGDPLPNTFYVKTGGGPQAWLRGLEYLGGFARDFGGPLLLLAPLALLHDQGPKTKVQRPATEDHGVTTEDQRRRTEDQEPEPKDHGATTEDEAQTMLVRPWSLVLDRSSFVLRLMGGWPGYLLLLSGAYAAYVVAVGGDHFPGQRFLVPAVPWLALLVAGGLAWLYRRIARAGLVGRLAPAALALILVGYGGYALGRSQPYDAVLAGNDESLWLWAEIGAWLAENAGPDESVAAMGAGAIAYYSDRTVIDLLGLTERHIARVPATPGEAPGHEKRDPAYVLEVRRPTYIPRIWDDYFGGPGALRGRYELITVATRYGREVEIWRLRQ